MCGTTRGVPAASRSRLGSLESRSHRAAPKALARAPEVGGASRDRTDDLLLAKQALSQLSYGPAVSLPNGLRSRHTDGVRGGLVVGLGGFEPPTSPLSGVRSNQLSYRPGARSSAQARDPELLGHQPAWLALPAGARPAPRGDRREARAYGDFRRSSGGRRHSR